MRNPLKIFWILLGFLCLGLGTIGIVLPILPTVPFIWELYSALQRAQSGSTPGLQEPAFIKNIWTVLCRKEP